MPNLMQAPGKSSDAELCVIAHPVPAFLPTTQKYFRQKLCCSLQS